MKDSLEWTLLYVSLHRDVQEKIVQEISEIIGFDRKPTYSDRTVMPYIQAVIHESMRLSSMLPLNLPHM